MKTQRTGALVLPACLCALAGTAAIAQDKPADSYVYATYSECDLNRQDRADEIFGQLDKPILDAAVADGTITSYGYNRHHTGGPWRVVNYFMAPTIDGLLAAQKKIGDATDAKNEKLNDEASAICGRHDDYIWRRVAGKIGTTSPGGAAFSTYYVCDSREKQADAIVEQLVAPVLDKQVADGKLKSWGWLEHIVGGDVRRLATMTAADLTSLMAARGELVEAIEGNALADQLSDICGSHSDYIWEVKYSNP